MKSKKCLSYGSPVKMRKKTEENPQSLIFALSESAAASPVHWRREWSTPSSFASSFNPRDTGDEAQLSTGFNPTPRPSQNPQVECHLQRIKQESEETQDYLRGLARHLHLRAEEVRSKSSLNTLETKAMKDFLKRLSGKMDTLLEDAISTEKMLEEMAEVDCKEAQSRSSNGTVEARIRRLEVVAASIHKARRTECKLEGEDASKNCLFC